MWRGHCQKQPGGATLEYPQDPACGHYCRRWLRRGFDLVADRCSCERHLRSMLMIAEPAVRTARVAAGGMAAQRRND
jgi:hypothetical protein